MPAFEERPVEEAEEAVGAYDIAVEQNTREMDKQEIEEFRRNLSWALGEVRHLSICVHICVVPFSYMSYLGDVMKSCMLKVIALVSVCVSQNRRCQYAKLVFHCASHVLTHCRINPE